MWLLSLEDARQAGRNQGRSLSMGWRLSGVKRMVSVSCQQRDLLSVKLGLKSYLLSGLLPAICPEELQSRGAGEGREGG